MNIKKVSEKFDLPTATLRYYEEVGLIPNVSRNTSGYRDYDEIDLEWVNFAKYMRQTGISINILKEYADLAQQGEATEEQRKQILIKQQRLLGEQIAAMQDTYNFLDNKIETYENHVKQMLKMTDK